MLFMGKLTISMVIFHGYVSLPEGTFSYHTWWVVSHFYPTIPIKNQRNGCFSDTPESSTVTIHGINHNFC